MSSLELTEFGAKSFDHAEHVGAVCNGRTAPDARTPRGAQAWEGRELTRAETVLQCEPRRRPGPIPSFR